MSDPKPGLGRIYVPDARDEAYRMASVLRAHAEPLVGSRFWRTGPVLNQGKFPHCVAYAWGGFLQAAPIMNRSIPDLASLYRRAQEMDEIPGTNYDGSTVRGGAKALDEMGLILEYRWAWDLETVVRWLLHKGTVVVGTTWFTRMSTPNTAGFVIPDGDNEGGHAYLLVGAQVEQKRVRMLNSWGPSWGELGRAWMTFDDLERLIDGQGEACAAVERRVPVQSIAPAPVPCP